MEHAHTALVQGENAPTSMKGNLLMALEPHDSKNKGCGLCHWRIYVIQPNEILRAIIQDKLGARALNSGDTVDVWGRTLGIFLVKSS